MAASLALPQFESFHVHSDDGNTHIRWKKWIDRFENLIVAMDIADESRKKALLLHYAGSEVHDIHSTLDLDQNEGDVYKRSLNALNEYFQSDKNKEYDTFRFRHAKQNTGENIDTYHTRLRKLAETCEFTNVNAEIKSQIIQSCKSSRLRRRGLRDRDMDLKQLLTLARTLEISEEHASHIENESDRQVNHVKVQPTYHKHRSRRGSYNQPDKGRYRNISKHDSRDKRQSHSDKKKCFNCGYDYPHKGKCPAKGEICRKCNGKDHFAKVCRKTQVDAKHKRDVKAVHEVSHSDSSSDDDYIFHVNENKLHSKQPAVKVLFQNTDLEMLVDTGAAVNIIDQSTYDSLVNKPKLDIPGKQLFGYDKKQIDISGCFDTKISCKGKHVKCTIYVAKGNYGSLLSYMTAVDLEIIPAIRVISQSKTDEILTKYADRFEGIGKVKDVQLKIHIDESKAPVQQQHRRIPFQIREKVETELKRLEDLDIIEHVDGPTPWVSPIVVAPKPKKPDEIRICVDMRLPNQAIKRERHITPTVDDIIADLSGSRVFSKLDLNAGYHQIELAPESRNITTFTTHVGLRRYKRLIFGISCAAEKFQDIIRTSLEGLEGVRNLSDDIIIFAVNQDEHDKRLEATLQRLRERGITLNRSKCEFNKTSVEFFGYVFSSKGLSADPKKIDAIKSAEAPNNVSELRSFLGLANYVSRFIPNFATIVAPLRTLTHKDVKWNWTDTEQTAFEALKNALIEDVIKYYDPAKPAELIVDASPVGLGAVLTQTGKVVAYASKSLSDVEKRYSQTEKESLAIVWGCEHFHLYLYGKFFTLLSDHKALQTIFNNPNSKPPARIERWRLRLQPYEFEVKYRPGKGNPADYMSRHPINSNHSTGMMRHSKVAEEYLCFVASNAVPKAMTLAEIAIATHKDDTLQSVMSRITNGDWNDINKDSEIYPYMRVKDKFSIVNNDKGSILLFETKIVIPQSLHKRVIDLAHEGHQGIVKTKQLLRGKVWFPGLGKQVEDVCKQCIPCLSSSTSTNMEPLKMTRIPEQPWTNLSADFCGPFPTGEYLLVIIDDHSRFPIVEIIHSTSARTVIPVLDKVFSIFGIPKVLKTDNGPPFQSTEFANFATYLGFHHQKITPLWPRANGEAERFMRTLSKAIKTANVEGLNWKQELCKFLRNYRATPHSTTSISPAESLLGRPLRTKLPGFEHKSVRYDHHSMIERDSSCKNNMKEYADMRNHASESDIKERDVVLVKQPITNKLTTPFNSNPMLVTKKKGSMITAENEDRRVTRNSSFFKKVKGIDKHQIYAPHELDDEPVIPTQSESISDKTSHDRESPPSRPNRERRKPTYLSDYVC